MSLLSMAQMMLSALTKPKQHIPLREIPPGSVIDLGGGGEGVIARAGGARITALDKRLSEIHEARGKATHASWLVADATRLPYAEASCDHATAFFSCMYMADHVKEEMFREACRVLKPGGELWIWDVPMASKRKVFAIRLQVVLADNQIINTIYGVKAKDQSAISLGHQLQQSGFRTEFITIQKHWFLIKAKKVS